MSAVKAQIGRSAKFIGQQAVQMHGGIAMTYEYKVGHLFKRLTMINTAFGDADVHIRRLADARQPVRLTLSSAARTILVTGFEPFGGETVNASWEATKKLEGWRVGDFTAVAHLLPCSYEASVKKLIRAIE